MADNPLDRLKGALEFFGSESTLDIIQYTLQRDALDARYFRRENGASSGIGPFSGMKAGKASVEFVFSNATLVVSVLSDSVVSVEWKRDGQSKPVIDHSGNFGDPAPGPLEVVDSGNGFSINMKDAVITVGRDGTVLFLSRDGSMLRKDHPPVFSSDGFSHSTDITDEARIFGFGEKAFSMNLRGRTFKVWNRDADGRYGNGADPLYLNIALYLSMNRTMPYLCFYENSGQATFDVGNSEINRIVGNFLSGPAKYYMIFGSLESIYGEYAKLTGYPHLPPRWSLGYHQSRWSYMDEEEVSRIASEFRKHDLPLSAIHLDIDYMDGFRIFTFDSDRFSGISKLSDSLKDQGIRLVTIIDPAVKWDPDYSVYMEGLNHDHFCKTPDGNVLYAPVWPGSAAFPDFTDHETREWWGSKYSGLLDAGISGFWHDMNEPAAFVLWGDNTLPLSALHKAGEHVSVHNAYGLLMAQAAHDALTTGTGRERPFILSRAGWAGQQKYSWIWTGDSESTWEELRQTVATVLGLSLSGIPYTGSDIGGFSGSPSSELFLRWFQMSSFLPFFRTHSAKGFPMREPWNFGEPYLSISRRFLKNRYSLIPYLYSEVYRTHTTGKPLIRPVFWDNGDFRLIDSDTEFMAGESLLVAPVVQSNSEFRTLQLPDGIWFDYWNPENSISGGGPLTVPVTLDFIPVFVRSASLIPTEEEKTLTLSVYVSEGGGKFSYELYSDDSRIEGKSRIDRFSVLAGDSSVKLEWSGSGDFDFPYSEVRVILHGAETSKAEVDGSTVDLEDGALRVSKPFREAEFTVKYRHG